MTNLSTRWITFTAFLLVLVTLALFMLRHASRRRVRQGFSIVWCSLCPRIIILD